MTKKRRPKSKVPKKRERRIPSHIHKFLKEMEWVFGIQNYDRNIWFEKNDKEGANGRNIRASVDFQEDYQRVNISIYPCFMRASRRQQREDLLHEFCHHFTSDLLKCAYDLRAGDLVTKESIRVASEKATSMTANVLDLFLRGRLSYARKAYASYLTAKK